MIKTYFVYRIQIRKHERKERKYRSKRKTNAKEYCFKGYNMSILIVEIHCLASLKNIIIRIKTIENGNKSIEPVHYISFSRKLLLKNPQAAGF